MPSPEDRKYIVHFGAGNIGRSLVGTIFTQAGYDVVFVDAMPEIVDALNSRHGYRVVIKDNANPEGVVRNVSGVSGILATDRDSVAAAVAGAELVCTAVGARILPEIIPLIALGVQRRAAPLPVILCENLHGAGEIAHRQMQEELPEALRGRGCVGFVETSIGKMVPIMPKAISQSDPLEVWAEPYNIIIADRMGFPGDPPNIDGLLLKENFSAWVDRKLFIHNLGHATCAWHGHMHGYTQIWECLRDPWIYNETRAAMRTSALALERRYPGVFAAEDLWGHIDDLLNRFANRALGDTVFRVGRDLTRKLAGGDRVLGAIRLCLLQGVDPEHICRAAAAALNFYAADENGKQLNSDMELLKQLETVGAWAVLARTGNLSPQKDANILERIVSRYSAFCPASFT